MMLVYTFLSVIPQEFIYRVFFFYRYRKLARKPELFYLWNALLFSIAHLMFHSWLVLVVTFIGGYIFAYTYSKTKSWFWVCVEHTLYGGWLFTVGLGKMLGFPI
ncbi:CPBP family intramembrane glutamic endopeptidase [Wenyingzhuangia sp. IMCC45574]